MPLVVKVGYAASSALVYEFKSVRVTQAYVYVHFCVRLAGTCRCICASHLPCAIVLSGLFFHPSPSFLHQAG